MAHIHTAAGQHDSTVSAFLVNSETNRLLLHRHRKLGILLQPGGHIELNEHPWQTMVHELEEETGYALDELEVLQSAPAIPGLIETVHPIPLAYRSHDFPVAPEQHFHTDAAFGFVVDHLPVNLPHEGESQELFWLDADELEAVADDMIPPDVRTIGLHLLKNWSSYERVAAINFAH